MNAENGGAPTPQSSTVMGTWNYATAATLGKKMGRPPEPQIVTPNPKFNEWIERAALTLCLEADECGVIPTPCAVHLREARDSANWLLTEVRSG